MKIKATSRTQVSNFDQLECVRLKFIGNRVWCFQIKSNGDQSGRTLCNEQKECAALQQVRTDHFATFQTALGNVTYIFLEDGRGYKLGPGVAQQDFRWV